ncbi:MAG TPA: diacylglycerol kinase family lipid kinase [Oscillospiraceae bacterium]|nr:diacylglycerol kinase family lipid kinase [Oscillospiraceae bacterium]HPF55943.1 diacylglycerol kinase family lipid kinase [Clostridiales bacterium]HPK36160.1 diacylglycerol kinase family lipid kinase [Oscillospiraceae bacterium]HPR76538.1 diacylglycerol kinase family lipid kinase [Oscillospiraceae bacterium]
MTHYFIINPTAGKGRPVKLIPKIEEACKKAKADFVVHLTESKQSAINFVKNATSKGEKSRVYAVGGDGTLNDVLAGIADFENTEICCVPCGTGNDFIKTLKIPREQLLDIDQILTFPSKKVDFMIVDDHRCLNICNIGIDSVAAYYMQEFKRLPLMKGSMPYLFGVLKSLFGKLGNELKIRLDGKKDVAGNYMLIAIANGQYYGGGYKAAPLAKVDDGLLDICLVNKVSRAKVLKLIGKYKDGVHLTHPAFKGILTYQNVKEIEIFSEEPLRICIDGDIFTEKTIKIHIEPLKLNFVVPANAIT